MQNMVQSKRYKTQKNDLKAKILSLAQNSKPHKPPSKNNKLSRKSCNEKQKAAPEGSAWWDNQPSFSPAA
jgi:hypothetical protein